MILIRSNSVRIVAGSRCSLSVRIMAWSRCSLSLRIMAGCRCSLSVRIMTGSRCLSVRIMAGSRCSLSVRITSIHRDWRSRSIISYAKQEGLPCYSNATNLSQTYAPEVSQNFSFKTAWIRKIQETEIIR
jgi:hypothetical protein